MEHTDSSIYITLTGLRGAKFLLSGRSWPGSSGCFYVEQEDAGRNSVFKDSYQNSSLFLVKNHAFSLDILIFIV